MSLVGSVVVAFGVVVAFVVAIVFCVFCAACVRAPVQRCVAMVVRYCGGLRCLRCFLALSFFGGFGCRARCCL